MLKPSCNIIKTPHKSYYSVVIAVAKRAREITQEAEDNNEIIVEKPVDLAVQDFVDEKYKIIEPDEIDGWRSWPWRRPHIGLISRLRIVCRRHWKRRYARAYALLCRSARATARALPWCSLRRMKAAQGKS